MKVFHCETAEASFDELLDFAKNNRARKLAHNTTLLVDLDVTEEAIYIQYHNTEIITFYSDGSVRLNSGGWETSTTKARFNAFLPKGITVFQNATHWYVETPAGTFEFEDGLVVSPITEWGEGGYTDAKVADVKGDAREYHKMKRAERKARLLREAAWAEVRAARILEEEESRYSPPPAGLRLDRPV